MFPVHFPCPVHPPLLFSSLSLILRFRSFPVCFRRSPLPYHFLLLRGFPSSPYLQKAIGWTTFHSTWNGGPSLIAAGSLRSCFDYVPLRPSLNSIVFLPSLWSPSRCCGTHSTPAAIKPPQTSAIVKQKKKGLRASLAIHCSRRDLANWGDDLG
jgi:hypothetical protein